MVLKSFSKINLSLNVNKRLKSGSHDIQSLFCLINLSDKIKILKIKSNKDKIQFKGPFAKLVKKNNNTVSKLLKLLRSLKLIESYYSITISKNIPVFAGLGGGTSNAAFILKHLLDKKINESLLKKIELIIGSDLRLFFKKNGFLKKLGSVTQIAIKQKLYFVLIKPKVKCSTKLIYSKVKTYSKKELFNKNNFNTTKKYLKYILEKRNDLQFIVEKKYPSIKKLLLSIQKERGCHISRMTGSGSVCYGLFKNQIDAKKALYNLKIKYPNFWVSLAKTV